MRPLRVGDVVASTTGYIGDVERLQPNGSVIVSWRPVPANRSLPIAETSRELLRFSPTCAAYMRAAVSLGGLMSEARISK